MPSTNSTAPCACRWRIAPSAVPPRGGCEPAGVAVGEHPQPLPAAYASREVGGACGGGTVDPLVLLEDGQRR